MASPMHMRPGETFRTMVLKYRMEWSPKRATSGDHITPGSAHAGGSGRASVGVPQRPTTVPERTGTFVGTRSCDVKR